MYWESDMGKFTRVTFFLLDTKLVTYVHSESPSVQVPASSSPSAPATTKSWVPSDLVADPQA